MSNLTSKKQNRILYLTLTVLLTAAVVLSVLTFQAAKKETSPLPETDSRPLETENPKPETLPPVKHPDAEKQKPF